MANCSPQRRPGAVNLARLAFSLTLFSLVLVCALEVAQAAAAQKKKSLPPDPSALRPPQLKDHFLADRLPEKPTLPPFATIPLDPMDFAEPNPVYLGNRFTMASLDFLDEDHILFTFRVPGLIRRTPGKEDDDDEHNIRAVVIAIPSGTIKAQAIWVLHGRDRYIWPLKGGRFLIRDGQEISVGDERLRVKPSLSFPGPVLDLTMDPEEQYLVTSSHEPVARESKTGASDDGPVDDHSTAPDYVLRVFRRASGDVLNVMRVRNVERIPINSQGILEALQGYSNQWKIDLADFQGGTKHIAQVVSQCMPKLEFLSDSEFLATTCKPEGGFGLIAITTSGQMLWQDSTSGYSVWPILRRTDAGLRFLHETLAATREIGAYWALDRTDVKAQRVRAIDAADGNVVFEATADPVLDAGGNAAISPSGRRVALLSGGKIEIFNLPPPPPLPAAATRSAAR
ncbi:MAG TPA: hypothetical protein VGR47_21350 [Terracidiphilus sp.]|nr:hypothetical protein [Terracidiphilus sp.]